MAIGMASRRSSPTRRGATGDDQRRPIDPNNALLGPSGINAFDPEGKSATSDPYVQQGRHRFRIPPPSTTARAAMLPLWLAVPVSRQERPPSWVPVDGTNTPMGDGKGPRLAVASRLDLLADCTRAGSMCRSQRGASAGSP
jgi:hypothetical protein